MKPTLAFGMGSIRRKDSSPMRRLMFERFLHYNPGAQEVWGVFESLRPTVLGAWLALARAVLVLFRYQWSVSEDGRYVVSQYGNEERVLRAQFPGHASLRLRAERHWPAELTHWLASTQSWPRWVRVARLLLQRRSSLVAVRQIQFLLAYSYFRHVWRRQVPREVVVSSESNPEVIGPALAAQSLGARAVYLNHGQLDRELGVFAFDQYVVTAPSVWERISAHLRGDVRDYQLALSAPRLPLKSVFSRDIGHVLVFTPVVVEIGELQRLVKELGQHLPQAQISLRAHPNPILSPSDLARYLPGHVRLTDNRRPFLDDLASVDLCVGSGSSAHVEALSMGVPSVYFRLDRLPEDHYGLLAAGLVPEVRTFDLLDQRLREVYGAPKWHEVFARYQHTEEAS